MVSEPYSRNPTLFPLPVFDQVARLSQRRVKKKPYIHSKHRLLELLTSNLRLLIESLLCKQSHLKCATVWKQAYINPTDDLWTLLFPGHQLSPVCQSCWSPPWWQDSVTAGEAWSYFLHIPIFAVFALYVVLCCTTAHSWNDNKATWHEAKLLLEDACSRRRLLLPLLLVFGLSLPLVGVWQRYWSSLLLAGCVGVL